MNESTIQETLQTLKVEYDARLKQAKKLLKLTGDLTKLLQNSVDEAFEIEKSTLKLQDLQNDLKDERIDKLLANIRESLKDWKRDKVLMFSRELMEEFASEGYELTARGSEYRVLGFVINADLSIGRASIEYAREVIRDKLPLKPKALIRAFKTAYKEICRRKLEPQDFAGILFAAYTRVATNQRQPMGSRVNVIEVLMETAFLMQKAGFRQDPSKENYHSYGRAHFSHDLNALRQANALTVEGRRLNIGTATIDFAEDRRKALYLTDGQGGGNFIMYIAFITMGE